MHPWLHIPWLGWSLRTSHLVLLITAALCTWQAARRLRDLDPSGWRRARVGFLLLAVAPWVGGHAHFLINNWRYARTSPALLFLPWNGFHAGGAIIALVFMVPVVARHFTLPLGRIADTLVPTAGLGIILGRLGCLAEGCCFGHACAWLWCVSFPAATHPYDLHIAHGRIAPGAMLSAPVHPLQLYFAGVGLVLLAMARWLQPRARYEGQVALLALVVFSTAAAALEPLRAGDDSRVYWGPLPQLQWTALAMTAGSLAALYVAERRGAAPRRVGGRASARSTAFPAGPVRSGTPRRAP